MLLGLHLCGFVFYNHSCTKLLVYKVVCFCSNILRRTVESRIHERSALFNKIP
jgi:hypothetical protein